MIGRILAAIAFLGGGVLMWFVLAALRGFAASQAGMSAGRGSGPPPADAVVPWFIIAYFALIGIGMVFARTRAALRIVAAAAYAMLAIAYCTLCFEALRDMPGKVLGGAMVLGFAGLIALSPWHSIWFYVLIMKGHDEAT